MTGWTPKEAIAKHLQPDEYAAIGQLYSPTRGINFLIRNLLANPHVRHLMILNATKEDENAGAGKCLLDFLEYGFKEGTSDTERNCWVIDSEIKGYVDIDIPKASLHQLRRHLLYRESTSIESCIAQVKAIAESRTNLPPWNKDPLIYPVAQVTPTVLPGPRYGHRIEGKTIAETWVKIIHRIKTTGAIRPTGYDGEWQELIDLMAVVTDEPSGFYFPNPNYLPCDKDFIETYTPQILKDSPRRDGVKYTYGQRLRSWFGRDQIEQVISKLIGEIDAASAVMSLWDVEDHEKGGSPCLNHIWLRVVDNELSLTATFRSNDMFGAWVANAMGLRALQQHICDRIADRSDYNLKMGPLITISQSAHIYSDCWENADLLIKQQYAAICKQRNYSDPSGGFVIAVKDKEILVEHLTSGTGEAIGCYCGRSARQIYQQIAAACPALETKHALYLGTELQKAECAIKMGMKYEQDRALSYE